MEYFALSVKNHISGMKAQELAKFALEIKFITMKNAKNVLKIYL